MKPWLAIIASGIVVLGPAAASGQTQPAAPDSETSGRAYVQGGAGILAGVPVGDFGRNVEGAGGLTGHLGVGIGDTALSLGGEASLLWYGEESRKVPLSLTIPDALVTVNTNNYLLLVHGRARVQRRHGRWRPYVDGLLGLNYIYTRTSVDVGLEDGNGSPSIAGTTNLGDVGPSYGGGAGVTIGFGSPPARTRLDISVRYVSGTEADYLRQGTIRRENGQAILDISHSRTDLVAVYIGASWATR